MKRRTRFVLSVAAGLLAVLVAVLYTSSVRSEAEQTKAETMARYGGDLVDVCVSTRDIEPGETIDDANVHIEKWVATLLPSEAVSSLRSVEGKKATSYIPKNTVVSPLYFKKSETALDIPRGKAAVSLGIDDEHALGGAVAAGDRVDVYVSKDGVSDRLCRATLVTTNVAMDGEGSGDITWATLAIDTENVEELLAASTRGTVNLVLPSSGASAEKEGEA